ncbi:MAG TPA: AAA family ATPase [Methylosinus sp.]|uniref:AAA family ATPase n=1 Tax=Methylosinus sp. TaxID=427 RepID=UPI002F925997
MEPADLPPPIGEPVVAAPRARKMALEWFDDAATLALDEPSNPLIEDLLDEGAFSVVYGDSNSGKTFIALDMAHAVATGRDWNGKRTRRGLVVYVAAEGGTRITRRLAALRRRYPLEKPLFALIRYPVDLRSSDANAKELLSLIRSAEAQCGERAAWIIVDTLSRALAGGDENSSVDMGRVVQAADHIRAETGAHFSYVHHCGKDAARGARGHSLVRAATDTEIEVAAGAIRATKQRDMECGAEFGFALADEILGEDASGRTIKSAVVEWGATTPSKSKPTKAIPRAQQLLMDTLAEAIGDAGEDLRPFGNTGPLVRAVAEQHVRSRYFDRIAAQPREGETKRQLFDRQRKSFERSLEAALRMKLVVAASIKEERLIWTP